MRTMPVPATRYAETAARLRAAIAAGTYPPGARLPSLRRLARLWGVAQNTVVAAYRLLESDGLVAALPRSGFSVLPPRATAPRTPPRSLAAAPAPVDLAALVMHSQRPPGTVELGLAAPRPELLPLAPLRRHLAAVLRDEPAACLAYDAVPGRPELRRAIARRLTALGAAVDPATVVVTDGAQEALQLALRAVCPPGACVAVESPAYPGLIQALAGLGLTCLEIPSSSATGISLDALRMALDEHRVAAVLCTASFSNPGGGCVPDAGRVELVELCRARAVALIDDDTYGELAHDGGHRTPCLAHDRDGLVLHVGSFSKCVAPGLRLGFLVPGRWFAAVCAHKITATIATAVLPQLAVARLLDAGDLDRHRRRALPLLRQAVGRCAGAVLQAFPPGTRVSQPSGGLVLWVELPPAIDSERLAQDALRAGISTAPGSLFSPRRRFLHHLRLTATGWDAEVERAIAGLGRLAAHQLR